MVTPSVNEARLAEASAGAPVRAPAEDPRDAIGARFARVAARHPGHAAVVEDGVETSYAALDARASAIAQRIVACGRRGAVGLLFERKRDAIEALLGACRSGQPYVPLDGGDPDARLAFIVADCEPAAIVAESSLAARAHALAPRGCEVIDAANAREVDGAFAAPAVSSDSPAMIYYTSGSTGEPKGVVQTHANLMHFARGYAATLGLTSRDRFALLYTLAFAAGNNGVLRSVLCGATVCAFDLRRDGIAMLPEWLDRERISVLQTVPTVFRDLCGRLAPDRAFPHLRAVHLAGEALFANDVATFRRHTLPQCLLMNQLGSTEACIVAQKILAYGDPLPATPIVPVGRPPQGVAVDIRRDDGMPAAVDEVGEVVVSSAFLSPGYWRRPALDRAAFGDDPARPGHRTFRSGDRGRIDAAGELHFIGRAGTRVKVRGHSVDLAEVEAALSAVEGVAACAVTVGGGDVVMAATRLVALVEPAGDAPRDPRRILRALAARLPGYMLPASIAFVERLPRLAGGKIDRAALATLAPVAADARVASPPRDEVERAVAAAFAQLLGLDGVGRDDDFFLLGGDSLLVTELQQRLLESLAVRVGPLHEDATVAAIAGAIRRARAAPPSRAPLPMLLPLWRHGSAPPLFLVHGRHGQAHVSPHFMRLLGDDQPVWSFQARGLDDLAPPHATIDAMAADYVAELRRVSPRGPYFIASLCVGAYVAAAMAHSLRDEGADVLPLLLLDPPNRMRGRVAAHADPARVAAKMKARKAQGRILGPVEDPRYLDAAIRTAAAFDDAVSRHRPQPYDGPAYVLSSRQRMHGADDWFELRTIFTGRVRRYEVAATHGEALDPRNPVFASTLTRCVELILGAARR